MTASSSAGLRRVTGGAVMGLPFDGARAKSGHAKGPATECDEPFVNSCEGVSPVRLDVVIPVPRGAIVASNCIAAQGFRSIRRVVSRAVAAAGPEGVVETLGRRERSRDS
ncbi:hypothetical protein GCM10023258_30360 [Terrabacter aeriphilus]|uniref:Uncharacterized protein n=1 Tax=Terrabacter aeriphilus TaxID=515662 RepID=A0ABP9JJZ2_9MICO